MSPALRVVVGMALAILAIIMVGVVVFPYLIDRDRPSMEPVNTTDGTATALSDELEFSMTDQRIMATVTGRGATVVELRRVLGSTTILVDILASVVLEPTTHVCYEFLLIQDKDVTFEKVDRCPITPPGT